MTLATPNDNFAPFRATAHQAHMVRSRSKWCGVEMGGGATKPAKATKTIQQITNSSPLS
ncbi:hypothetical protein [Microlunatus phosphovorus]|nr:hypothetical protein [Microlunatus phosphovorus]